MKRIKGVTRKFHKLAMKATSDYYFNGTNLNVLKAVESEKVSLTDEEKSDVWAIKTNLGDEIYTNSLI